MDIKHRIQSNKQWGLSMKKKVLGIVIACTILIGLLAFYISHQQATNTPETEASPDTAVSEIEKTVDSVETNIAISDSSSSNEREVTSTEKPEATATPQVTMSTELTSTPEPVQATPQPTAVPQPEQSYDDGSYDPTVDDLWVEDGSADDQGFDWSDTVLE